MLKRVVHSLDLVEQKEKDSRRKNRLRGREAPPTKDFVVSIIHAVPVFKLTRKYPGMLFWHEDVPVPGHKYILISFRDVDKLKSKLLEEERSKEANGVSVEMVDTDMEGSLGEGGVEESFFSAKDFYAPKEKSTSTRPSRRKGLKGKKPFVAPLPKAKKLYRSLGWQPSLPTVKEPSP
uniref:Uncharacterized protein n=1 Tax=Glycine max TaxID=3847 RepID=A0A0R0J1W7_SOYBN